jgi:MOSC domain-containing protein YiiM
MLEGLARVVEINISEKKGVQKKPINSAQFIKDHGIKGDAHAGNWHRQVSLLGIESINKMKRLSAEGFSAGDFAENITTEGIELYKLPIGRILNIGDVVLEVTQIGKECHQKCAIYNQVGECIMPKEGIFARVVKSGMIKKGDVIL